MEIGDLSIVTRKVDDQSISNGVPDKTCSRASRRDRKTCVRCRTNDKTRLLCGFRKRCTDGLYLVNRCVSRVELTRQVVEAPIATGLSDFAFLRRNHSKPDGNVAQPCSLWDSRAPRLALNYTAGLYPSGPTPTPALPQQ